VDQEAKVLIVGDLLIDRTYYVDVSKLSPEAPVPVAMLTGDPIDTPGGAGLAAAFTAIDKIPAIFGTYASLDTSLWVNKQYNIPVIHPQIYSGDLNAIKTRYIDNERHYHLIRVDSDNIVSIPFDSEDKDIEYEWFNEIEDAIKHRSIKVLAILDYRKGLLNEARSQRLINIARKASIPVYVDSRSKNLSIFKGANILKLNANEFKEACHILNCYTPNGKPNPQAIISSLQLDCLIITNGAEGAEYHMTGKHPPSPYKISAPKCQGSPDVTGCGDVFDITFCYNWGIKNKGIEESLKLAVNRATQFAYEPLGERLKWQK